EGGGARVLGVGRVAGRAAGGGADAAGGAEEARQPGRVLEVAGAVRAARGARPRGVLASHHARYQGRRRGGGGSGPGHAGDAAWIEGVGVSGGVLGGDGGGAAAAQADAVPGW